MIVEVAGVGKDYARKSKESVDEQKRSVATRNQKKTEYDNKQLDIHCLKLCTFFLTISKHDMRFSMFPSAFAVHGRCMTLMRTGGGASRAAGRGTLCFLPVVGIGVERAEPRELFVTVFVAVASSETRGRLDAS